MTDSQNTETRHHRSAAILLAGAGAVSGETRVAQKCATRSFFRAQEFCGKRIEAGLMKLA
jgi:hypothetical protein